MNLPHSIFFDQKKTFIATAITRLSVLGYKQSFYLSEDHRTHKAQLGGQLEVGYVSGADSPHSRPADILVPNWMIGKPAAFDLTVVSLLNSNALYEVGAIGSAYDIRPIAVGKVLRRLTGKCLCTLTKHKATEFFQPLQFGVACPSGTEKVIHGLRTCLEEYWEDDDFAVVKVDMRNAFNLVFRQALLDECAIHFPELLPWASWCCGSHPLLWHPLGHLSSQSGVQKGDPLGPLFFSLVLRKITMAIDADDDCLALLFNAWFLDDGLLAGMKVSHEPHLVILGAPIGDYLFCASYIASKGTEAMKLLSRLVEVACFDPQKLECFTLCTAVPVSNLTWQQAQLSLSHGGLGLRSVSHHSSAAYIASLCSSGFANRDHKHLACAVDSFNSIASLSEIVTVASILASPMQQRALSMKIEDHQFSVLYEASLPADKARLLFTSAPHASSWLLVTVAFDVTVTSPLSVSILPEASVSVGAAALEAGVRKHRANDPKCSELGWVCVPLTVETYGNWGKEAQATFSRLASCIATTSSCHKSQVLGEMYGRLNFTLVQAISRAILATWAAAPADTLASFRAAGEREAINSEVLLLTPVTQKSLSSKLDDHLFKVLLDMSSVADKARLLSVSSPHAASWLSVTVLVSISTLPNSRLPLNSGLAWTFPMVLAAHCALRLP
eukprot:Em0013g964a